MKPERKEYEGHRIEVREREGKAELVIDDVVVPHGRLPNGSYFLHEYAYDWGDSLMDLAQKFLDHRRRAERVRRERTSERKGEP